ncbi:transposase [Chryseobacterium tructae]|uniref:transposase n=1 Tax=Chryseobacterium tructae TaxID=1037380 RepID=UPI003F490CA6
MFGLAPRIYQSGKKNRILLEKCRTSKTHIRSLLYVCSWTAIKTQSPIVKNFI